MNMQGWTFKFGDEPTHITEEHLALFEALASEVAALQAQPIDRSDRTERLRPLIARLQASGLSIDQIAVHGRLPVELVHQSLR